VALLLPATDFGARGVVPALAGEGEWCAAGGGIDPVEAAPGTIRGDDALSFLDNIVHGPGSPGQASGNQDLLSGARLLFALAAE